MAINPILILSMREFLKARNSSYIILSPHQCSCVLLILSTNMTVKYSPDFCPVLKAIPNDIRKSQSHVYVQLFISNHFDLFSEKFCQPVLCLYLCPPFAKTTSFNLIGLTIRGNLGWNINIFFLPLGLPKSKAFFPTSKLFVTQQSVYPSYF